MHTSALQYTGTLLRNAQVRTSVQPSDGHTVPVLCLDLQIDNALQTHLHVEQVYPAGCHDLCHTAAKRHKEGLRVCVTVPLEHIHLTAKHVTHIEALPAAPEKALPSLF